MRIVSACVIFMATGAIAAAQDGQPARSSLDDYPTALRVEYVVACMSAHSDVPLILEKCSCSFDEMARRIPYKLYLKAETISRMRRTQGERSLIFKESPELKRTSDELRQAQIDAALACFPASSPDGGRMGEK